MTSTRIHPSDVLMAILAATLAAGIPFALWTFAGDPLPTNLPSQSAITALLTTRDDGTLFLQVLTWTGWIAWATFLYSLVIPTHPSEGTRP